MYMNWIKLPSGVLFLFECFSENFSEIIYPICLGRWYREDTSSEKYMLCMLLRFLNFCSSQFIYLWHHNGDWKLEIFVNKFIHIYITLLWTYFCVTDEHNLFDSMEFFFEIPWYKCVKISFQLLSHLGKSISREICKMIFPIYKKNICCSRLSWFTWGFY